MVQLGDLVDQRRLTEHLANGYIRVQRHPFLPYSIANYTHRAQFDAVWDETTKVCRGLIWNHETGEVVARGFRKPFNHGEHPDANLDLQAPARVMDKVDGSLGILYPVPTDDGPGYNVATRGSFTSAQATHATAIWEEHYAHRATPMDGFTYLFEIVYPSNRIVVDYGETDDLVLLGAVHVSTGSVVAPTSFPWPGPRAKTFEARTLGEALGLPPRENAEGLVVTQVSNGQMAKLKQSDYLELHRIVTGLNERAVWERLSSGTGLEPLIESVPPLVREWVNRTGRDLLRRFNDVSNEAADEYRRIMSLLPEDHGRKQFAEHAKKSRHAPHLFKLLDGRDPSPGIWKDVKPEGGGLSPMSGSEDNA